VGDRLSTIDFLATMLMRWSRKMPRPATDWPNIARYVSRMRALPSFIALCDAEGLTEWRNP
jgi:glutathione S-transferase